MSGFGKVSIVGEYFGNTIVNVLHYRSTAWLPLQGNPFDDVLAFVDAIWDHIKVPYLFCLPNNYTCLRVEGVGYDDSYSVVTASPIIRTVNAAGTCGPVETTGAWIAANIGLRCGEQVQIGGLAGKSKRNRGYLAIGPVDETAVDNYGHIRSEYEALLDHLAETLDDGITMVAPAVTLTPIRLHQKYQRLPAPLPDVLLFRTYSDIKGYTLPRKATARKSRMSEA